MTSNTHNTFQRGFTLIELLVVVSIVGILMGLVISAAQTAREEARRALCMSNLRQMALAALTYESQYGEFPPAYERDFTAGTTRSWESCLWDQGARYRIQQCPSFHGDAMWEGGGYAGYNYNTSYIGGRVFKRDGRLLPGSSRSASLAMIADPSQCALFGDGEYERGANKFMRSPKPGRNDSDGSLAKAGTQGFRHRGRTNVAFADAHVTSLRNCYGPNEDQPDKPFGFLSPDNSLYDLE